MRLIRWLRAFLFGCPHPRLSFPMTIRGGRHAGPYVVCLECGREFNYNWHTMRICR